MEVIGMLVGNFLENPKKYPDFDFKPQKNTQILRAVLKLFWETGCLFSNLTPLF